jgi:hypothetical protein
LEIDIRLDGKPITFDEGFKEPDNISSDPQYPNKFMIEFFFRGPNIDK